MIRGVGREGGRSGGRTRRRIDRGSRRSRRGGSRGARGARVGRLVAVARGPEAIAVGTAEARLATEAIAMASAAVPEPEWGGVDADGDRRGSQRAVSLV